MGVHKEIMNSSVKNCKQNAFVFDLSAVNLFDVHGYFDTDSAKTKCAKQTFTDT